MSKYVIGMDYGSDSVRALLVNVENGEEISTSVYHHERNWLLLIKKGRLLQ